MLQSTAMESQMCGLPLSTPSCFVTRSLSALPALCTCDDHAACWKEQRAVHSKGRKRAPKTTQCVTASRARVAQPQLEIPLAASIILIFNTVVGVSCMARTTPRRMARPTLVGSVQTDSSKPCRFFTKSALGQDLTTRCLSCVGPLHIPKVTIHHMFHRPLLDRLHCQVRESR